MLSLVVATCVIGSILTSCKSSSEKVENARTKVEEAEADTTKTNQNYSRCPRKFKSSSKRLCYGV